MSKKVRLEAQEILRLQQRRRQINAYQIDEIVITDPDGNRVIFSDEFIDHWTLTGLNTTDLELVLYDEQGNIRNEIGMEVWKKKT